MLHLEFAQSADTTLEEVASVIIHEATHGRIRDRGITYGEDKRDAVERACIAEQIRFLKRLPTVTEEMIAPLQQRMDCPASFWSNASRRAKMFATARLKLKETGCPQWLMWPLLKLLDRREKALQARETEGHSPR